MCFEYCRGQGSPNNRGKCPFQKIIKHKLTNPRTTKRAPRGRGLEQRRAHSPRSLNGPPNGRLWYSVSLEVASDPRRRTYSLDESIKCSGTPQMLGSKANPRHAGPLTSPGNHIPSLFHQLALCGGCAGRPVSTPRHCATHSRTASTLHPSKEDGGTLERRTDAYSAPA
jgi:hypothetical protein